MWSVLSHVGQMLGLRHPEPEVDWDAVAAVLDAEDDIDPFEQEISDNCVFSDPGGDQIICQHRVGVVKELYDDHGYITSAFDDGKEESRPLYFLRENAPANLEINNRVVYLAFRMSEESDWVVRKVLYVENELWDKSAEAEVEDDVSVNESVVKKDCETAYKHVVAKVTGREGRTVFAGDVQFSLDAVQTDFIPVEGDWLSLDSLVQPEAEGDTVLTVDRITPLRSSTRDGRVTHWTPDSQLGIVDSEVVFSKEACEPGYLPRVDDQVTVFCIESEQGQLTWRAVQVVPISDRKIQCSHDPQLKPLLQDKQGIVISENTNFGIVSIGQESQITVELKNEGNCSQTFVTTEIANQDSQFWQVPLPSPPPVILKPQGSLHIAFKVRGRFVGRSTELVKFKFDGFEIGRLFAVDIQTASLSASLAENRTRDNSRSMPEPITARKLLATRNGFIVKGVRPIKPASFVPVHLGMFVIPEKLVKLVLGTNMAPRKDEVIADLLNDYQCLSQPLIAQNYVLRWDILIHLEELEHMVNISRYNTTAPLHRVEEYLSLEIPGLSERRPSLIVGDHVIVRPTWIDENSWGSDGNNVAYEGFIHKVLSNEVLLKFNPSFHDTCSGVYSVSFQGNRTSFRRLHQAVHVGFKNLTADWLFPSKINYQPPQIVIIGEEDHLRPEQETKDLPDNVNVGNKTIIEEKPIFGCDKNIESDNTVAKDLSCRTISSDEYKDSDRNSINDTFISAEKSVNDILNTASDIVNNEKNYTTNKSRIGKRQKSKVSDMLEKLSTKDEIFQKVSPPRVPVVERFLQNGNCHFAEKSPKEVKNMLKQLASLPCNTSKNNTEMKTLEEIEKSLLKTVNNSALDGITPLPENNTNNKVEKGGNASFWQNEKSDASAKNQKEDVKSDFSLEGNRGHPPKNSDKQREENYKVIKNSVNESTRASKVNHDQIKWNSNQGMKLGNEEEANSNIKQWKMKKIRWFNPLLNHYQKEAVRNILKGEARPLPYVIFGPPGTGKTITVVEAILQIYFLMPESRLLIATPSNSAADLVCERLLESGLLAAGDLLRLCSHHYAELGRVSDSLKPYCGTADIKSRDNQSHPLPNHAQEGVVNVSRHAIGRHRVTVGTCGALAVLYQMGFPRGHFTHVVVDEAGQATEPEILIPLVFLHKSYGQAILAGDPLQLGPVVLSSVAEHFGLGESFLSRLLTHSPYCRDTVGYPDTNGYNPYLITRLVYNYRSLPEILELPNNMFYDGDLIPQISEESSEEVEMLNRLGPVLPRRPDQTPPALVFHGVRGTNCQAAESPSWYNPHEAVQAALYLQSLYNAGFTPDQCGIITPYLAQVLKIRQLLETLEVELPKVGSVEEFQGQERMVVILSTVRSSPRLVETDVRHSVGFVASPRRLNVAITRARACLIVLGNPHLLARDHYWRTVLQYCVQRGGYMGCDLPADL